MSVNSDNYLSLNNEENINEESKCIKGKKIFIGIIVVCFDILIGSCLSLVILFIIAEKTKSAISAYIIQFLFILVFVGGITYLCTYFIGINKTLRLIISLAICLIFVLFFWYSKL